MVTHWVRKRTYRDNLGFKVNGKQLTNLRFADDVVLFTNSATNLQEMISELNAASKTAGLSINYSKTKIMSNGRKDRITVEGSEIQYVKDYLYLGQLISLSCQQDKEIKRRIGQAWRSFWALKHTRLNKGLNKNLRLQILKSCVSYYQPCSTGVKRGPSRQDIRRPWTPVNERWKGRS